MVRDGFYSHFKNQNKQPENGTKTLDCYYRPKGPIGRVLNIIKLIHLRVDNILMELSQFAQCQKNGQILALVQMTSVNICLFRKPRNHALMEINTVFIAILVGLKYWSTSYRSRGEKWFRLNISRPKIQVDPKSR